MLELCEALSFLTFKVHSHLLHLISPTPTSPSFHTFIGLLASLFFPPLVFHFVRQNIFK